MIYAGIQVESQLWDQGFKLICGIDEVGRGCFAGPVVAGAVVFSKDSPIPEGIADSKLLKPKQRERLTRKIKEAALGWAVGEIGVNCINRYGIGKATQMAFRKAIKNLSANPDFVIIDTFYVKHLDRRKQKAIKNGDKLSVSIAAASIIAKVYRDKLMRRLHRSYPNYGFSKHKGYGTKFHQDAIRAYGLSRLHRKSFNLRRFLAQSTVN